MICSSEFFFSIHFKLCVHLEHITLMTIINQRWSLNNYGQGRDCSSASSCIQLPFKADQAVLCFNSSTSRRRMGRHLQGSSLIGVGAPRKSCLLVHASCFWSANSISSHGFDWWPSKGQETRGVMSLPPRWATRAERSWVRGVRWPRWV